MSIQVLYRLIRTLSACLLVSLSAGGTSAAAPSVDELADLGSSASPIVTLKARDNFLNEFRYDVSVRNQAAEPIESGSLVLVLDQITDLAGKDALDRIEVLGQDGETAEGKPYFRIPLSTAGLAPYTVSPPATVRLRNSAYTIIFTPSFRVRGMRRSPVQQSTETVRTLIQVLEKKGVITQEDLQDVLRSSSQPQPPRADREPSGAPRLQ
jgi:hypothetical protein